MGMSVKVAVALAALAWLVVVAAPAVAADSPVGTWVRQGDSGRPEETMTIEEWGVGNTKLSTSTKGSSSAAAIMSNLDGADSPILVDGKASTATVALSLLDQQHAIMVTKLNIQPIGTSKWTFSPDFKKLTIEDDFSQSVPGTPAGKSTEHWTRK